MLTPVDLFQSPNKLVKHYSRFRVDERLLLTGHSHQAWPDCGLEGQKQAWLDAAEFVDEKWQRAFAKAELVRNGFARLLDDENGIIALAGNTHELVIRFLSALPLKQRPKIVTTDGEFHTIRRQLDRLAEEEVKIVKVAAYPASSVSNRLADAVDDHTAAVLVSSVYFNNAHIVPGLSHVLEACTRVGAELLIDVYHTLNIVPFSIKKENLQQAFIVGGGYKYCQLGEGNCFLRFPKDCQMRPVITGWFSEFDALTDKTNRLSYGKGPARFAGATYDPTSHYRAAEVFAFFDKHQLTPEFLRKVSQHQVGLLQQLFDNLDADPKIISRDHSIPLENIGGFLALDSPYAEKMNQRLSEHGVLTDYRDETLRLGPAPYLSDDQLGSAIEILGEIIRNF